MHDDVTGWLRRIPGWESATVESLGGGRSNRTVRLIAGERSAVLKLDVEPRSWPGNGRAEEAAVQQAAAAAGLAAPVIWHGREGIMTEWLPGRTPAPRDLSDPGLLVSVGKALRRMHALHHSGRRFDLERWACFYRERLERRGRYDDEAAAACRLLSNATLPSPSVLSHNDLVPANIVASDQIRFIDWEYACSNSWQFDLATLHVEAGLDAAATRVLFDAYCGSDRVGPDFAETVAVYRALVRLWERAELPGVA
jgi:Ser/Thr protein kinase RdoA (MazF antagonist)